MAVFFQIAGVALCHFRTGLISASVMLNNFSPDFFHGDIFADCQAALCNGLHGFGSGFVILNDFFMATFSHITEAALLVFQTK